MIRRWIAVSLCALVPAALLASPLVHLHADDHASSVMHSHLDGHHSHHDSHGTAVEAADHSRVLFVNALCGVAGTSVAFAAPAAAADTVPEPPTRRAKRSIERTHGHDPPLIGACSLRAPPALLS